MNAQKIPNQLKTYLNNQFINEHVNHRTFRTRFQLRLSITLAYTRTLNFLHVLFMRIFSSFSSYHENFVISSFFKRLYVTEASLLKHRI